jgi:hypothetical protein
MKLIWHIIKKDFTHDRWALLLWAGLFVVQVGLGLAGLNWGPANKDLIVQLQLASAIVIFLQVIMGYILVTRLVHTDAVIGAELFWVTRPISRCRLLAAKGLGALLIFGLLPVALLLPWWIYNDFTARDILWAAVETLGWQLLMIAPAFLVASLTDDLGRVLLWTLLLVMGLMIWFVLLQSVNLNLRLSPDGAAGVLITRSVISALLVLVGATLVVGHHYLTRNFVRSVVLVFLGLGVLALVSRVWQWDCSRTMAEISLPVPVAPAGLVEGMTLQAGRAWVAAKPRTNKENDSSLRVTLNVQGLPAEMSLLADDVTQTWRWPQSPVFKRSNQFGMARIPAEYFLRQTLALPVPAEDPETVRWYQAMREREQARREQFNAGRAAQGLEPIPFSTLSAAKQDGLSLMLYAVLPDGVIAKMRVEPPAYTARIEGAITRPALVAELPLKVGARTSGDAQTFRLVHLLPLPQKKLEATAAMIISTAPSIRKSGLWITGEFGRRVDQLFRSQWFDVNHTMGNISRVSETRLGEARIGGVTIKWQQMAVYPFTMIRNGEEVLKDLEWREHTTLVFVTEKAVARFSRDVQADRLELDPSKNRN